jgi:hypothetical protein
MNKERKNTMQAKRRKKKEKSPNKGLHPKAQNPQWRALREEITQPRT